MELYITVRWVLVLILSGTFWYFALSLMKADLEGEA